MNKGIKDDTRGSNIGVFEVPEGEVRENQAV